MVIIIVIAARLHETAESEADKLLRSCARWACADVTWTCCLNFAPEGDTDTVTRWRGRWQVASGSQQPAGSMQHAAQASCQSPIDCWQSPFAWHLHCKTPLTCSSSNCCLTLTISGHTHTHTHTQSHSQVSCNTCTALLQRVDAALETRNAALHTQHVAHCRTNVWLLVVVIHAAAAYHAVCYHVCYHFMLICCYYSSNTATCVCYIE